MEASRLGRPRRMSPQPCGETAKVLIEPENISRYSLTQLLNSFIIVGLNYIFVKEIATEELKLAML